MAATNTTQTFADAGVLFNDATRFLEGGVWQTAVSEGGQGLGSAGRVVSDLQLGTAIAQATPAPATPAAPAPATPAAPATATAATGNVDTGAVNHDVAAVHQQHIDHFGHM
jgi:hypothetical protein